jgi:uncharacterized protein (TIGR03435 family)
MTVGRGGRSPGSQVLRHRGVRALLLVLMAAANTAAVATEGPKAGEPAPALSAEVLLNAPEGASVAWGDLKGKVVVVEFWATWCAPCIASIPHLNDLAEKFQGKDVVFISLTSEPRRTVEPFLKRKPIKGWVALDTDDRAGEAYGVDSIPRTFIVGRDGKLLGETNPQALAPEHIARALRGEPLGLAPEDADDDRPRVPRKPAYAGGFRPGRFPAVRGGGDPLPDPLLQIVVRPALDPKGGSSGGSDDNRQTWINADAAMVVREAYGRAYRVPMSRVEVKARVPEQRLDVAIWAPRGDILPFRRLVEAGLGGPFRLSARTEERVTDILLLTTREAGPLKLTPTVSTGGSMMSSRRDAGRTVATLINRTAGGLADILESRIGVPVFDDTGLTKGYDFEIILPDDLGQARETLRPLGLRLEPARRKLTWLVIEASGPH